MHLIPLYARPATSTMPCKPHAAAGFEVCGQSTNTYPASVMRRHFAPRRLLAPSTFQPCLCPRRAPARPLASSPLLARHARRLQDNLPVANQLNRFSLGSRDKLITNPDGSTDIYVQPKSPGPNKKPNWLPAPQDGAVWLMMRLYMPKAAALDGTWKPPPVIKAA